MNKKTLILAEFYLATLLLGVPGIFAKLIDMPAGAIIFFRASIAALVLFVFLKISRQGMRLGSAGNYLKNLLIGVLFGIHWLAFFYSIQISNVAVGVISIFTFPVMTTILEPLFSGEKYKAVDFIAAGFVLLGIYFVVPEFDLSNDVTMGVVWGLVSAVAFSLRDILTRQYTQEHSSSILMFYQFLVSAFVALPFVLFGDDLEYMSGNLWLLLLLGVAFTGLPHTLYARGLKHLSARVVAVLSSAEILYSILFAYIFLSEVPDGRTLFGGAIIFCVVLAETYGQMKQAPRISPEP